MKSLYFKPFTVFVIFCISVVTSAQNGNMSIEKVLEIDKVPADFPVGFCLLTHGNRQYAAYYNADREMTVACRTLDSDRWDYKVLDNKVGWDSHNSIVLKIDSKGYIHVSGNMHASPLIYYISRNPFDIQSLEKQSILTGKEENRMTYPHFMDGPNGEFLYHYRMGGSGNGYEIYNVWDAEKREWQRYLDQPLTDGRGERNAYMSQPTLGPDGYFHMIWVWRETPDCATNHTLSYARSKDMKHWESIRGEKVELPMTLDEKSLYVDATQPGGGLFNPGIRLGFDATGKPVIGYHKYDKDMNTQLYISRFENGNWTNEQITDWKFRWIFQGNGSIASELILGNFRLSDDGRFVFGYWRKDTGSKELLLDAKTFKIVGEREATPNYPPSIDNVESTFPGIRVMKAFDTGKSPDGSTYMLRWETLNVNRDRKPEGELPPPCILRLYKYSK